MWKEIIAAAIVLGVFLSIFVIVQTIRNYGSVKKQKEHFRQLHTSLKVGDKVSFSNGFYGKIKSIDSNMETVDVEIKQGIITVSRYAIMEILK